MLGKLQWWLAGTLRRRLTFGMGLVVATLMVLFVADMTRREEALVMRQQADQATALAQSVAKSSAVWLASRDFAGLQEIIDGLAGYPDLRHAMVLDIDGQVLAHGDATRRGMFLADLPQEAKAQILQRNEQLVDAVSPVMLSGKLFGWARIGLAGDALAEELDAVRRNGLYYTLFAIVLSSLFASLTGRYLTRRLDSIQRVADAVQAGNLALRAQMPGDDEAARLARQFNRMLDRLTQQQAELQKYQQHLESLVEERTRDLEQAKEIAETASRAKSTFLANMSHELRTPMNAIMGLTELALRRAEEPKLRDQLGKVIHASRHLLHVINDILDISKIEADRLKLEHINFKLGEVLENLMSLIGHKALDKHLKLLVDLSPEVARLSLFGDPLRLGQILLNLSGNAIKFTEQGAITLHARLVEENPTEVLLRFEVQDTGIGIAAENQPRLFTAFEQADGSMTRKYGGTGLGLAISKRLVQLMGGEIGVESATGQGSTFWFTVRLGKSVDAVAPAPTLTEGGADVRLKARHASARILLAEDEPMNQEVSKGLLEDAGLSVDLADDGAKAVELASRHPYDLILMDMQMPNLNGVDATRAIRALPGYALTPILAMTANAFEEDRQVCLDAGMNDHIAKPVDPNRLFEMLLKWLDINVVRERGQQAASAWSPPPVI